MYKYTVAGMTFWEFKIMFTSASTLTKSSSLLNFMQRCQSIVATLVVTPASGCRNILHPPGLRGVARFGICSYFKKRVFASALPYTTKTETRPLQGLMK